MILIFVTSILLISSSQQQQLKSSPTQLKQEEQQLIDDVNHDADYFLSNESFKSSLKYGSPFLPRHLYDFSHLYAKYNPIRTRSTYNITTSTRHDFDTINANRDIVYGYSPYPKYWHLPPDFLKLALINMMVTMEPCLTSSTSTTGFTDPDLGTFNLDPDIYCQPASTRFIPGSTCCLPRRPRQLALRLLLFPSGRGKYFNYNHYDYHLNGEARAVNTNYGPVDGPPVTELYWRSKSRPPLVPSKGKVVFLIHGGGDNVNTSQWLRPAARAWNEKGATVLVLDWKDTARAYTFQAVADIRVIGAIIGHTLIKWGLLERSSLVGHSYGAHIIAEAANFVKRRGKQKIKRCVGLDPAGAAFDGGPHEIRLTRDDCDVVAIVHTAAEYTKYSQEGLAGRPGTLFKSGHCDYWINCGHDQGPQCTSSPPLETSSKSAPSVTNIAEQLPLCGHIRAVFIYLAQLRGDCYFNPVKCTDCGTESNQFNYRPFNECQYEGHRGGGRRGFLPPFDGCYPGMNENFYVSTSDRYPFC